MVEQSNLTWKRGETDQEEILPVSIMSLRFIDGLSNTLRGQEATMIQLGGPGVTADAVLHGVLGEKISFSINFTPSFYEHNV